MISVLFSWVLDRSIISWVLRCHPCLRLPHYELCLIKSPSDTVRAVDSGAPLTDTDHLRPEHTHAKTHCKIDAKHFSPSYTYLSPSCHTVCTLFWQLLTLKGIYVEWTFLFQCLYASTLINQALQEPRLVFVWVAHIWRASTAKHIFAFNLFKPQLVFTPSPARWGDSTTSSWHRKMWNWPDHLHQRCYGS